MKPEVEVLMGVWGTDNRLDWHQISNEQVRKNADCVAAICDVDALTEAGKGHVQLNVKKYGEAFNLCDSEPFFSQPIAGGRMATGFLVKEDIIATAGHIISEENLKNTRFIFGFRMLDNSTARTKFPTENIYQGIKIINRIYRPTFDKSDWALVKLDRKVVNYPPAKISEGKISPGQQVYMIGHPLGLPLKYSAGASVRRIGDASFSADLDVFSGNSGTPVFRSDTHEAIGFVIRGDSRDFRWTGNGWVSVIYPNNELRSTEPECTKITELSQNIPFGYAFNAIPWDLIYFLKKISIKTSDKEDKFLELIRQLKTKPLSPDFESLYLHALLKFSITASDIAIHFFSLQEVQSIFWAYVYKNKDQPTAVKKLYQQFRKFTDDLKKESIEGSNEACLSIDDCAVELEKLNNWFCYFQNHTSNKIEANRYQKLLEMLEESRDAIDIGNTESDEPEKDEYQYDVALSFAGEERLYVQKVAETLRDLGVRVFYDEFENAALWGKNLIVQLQEVYRDQSKYVVMFCSKHYVKKLWPNHERVSAQERAFVESSEYILPAKFDDTEIPGLPRTVGYINLKGKTAHDFSLIIAEKLKVSKQNKKN